MSLYTGALDHELRTLARGDRQAGNINTLLWLRAGRHSIHDIILPDMIKFDPRNAMEEAREEGELRITKHKKRMMRRKGWWWWSLIRIVHARGTSLNEMGPRTRWHATPALTILPTRPASRHITVTATKELQNEMQDTACPHPRPSLQSPRLLSR